MRLKTTSWYSFTAVLMLSSALAGGALGMTFDLQERCINGLTPRCQQMVVAEGLISKDTPAEFKEWSKNLTKGCVSLLCEINYLSKLVLLIL